VEVSQGALRRFAGDIRPSGSLTGSLLYEWKDDLAAQRLEMTKLSSPQLIIAAPAYLGADKPSVRLTSASGGIEIAGKRLLLDQVQIQTDVAALSASIAGEAPTLDLAGILAAVQSTKKDDGIEVSGKSTSPLPAACRKRCGCGRTPASPKGCSTSASRAASRSRSESGNRPPATRIIADAGEKSPGTSRWSSPPLRGIPRPGSS
jgi:hypothetical protein